jgi:hypothetical protein
MLCGRKYQTLLGSSLEDKPLKHQQLEVCRRCGALDEHTKMPTSKHSCVLCACKLFPLP